MAAVAVLTAVFAAVTGCGGSDPFDYVPVSGKVTYEDGTRIPDRLQVTFVPQTPPIDKKTYPRHGLAEINDDGTFDRVTSYKPGDGIVPGRHKVLVQAFTKDDDASDAVPPEYNDIDKTPLEIDTADYSPDKPFHFQIAKPESK